MSISKSEFFQKRWSSPLHLLLNFFIASVWLINGLYAKLLGGLPRHEMIVARILGSEYSYWLTKGIGFAELVMVVWILSRILPRLCAVVQITIVMVMNLLELAIARDLLLFGGYNLLWASLFCGVVALNEFVIRAHRPSLPAHK